jgi:hypothetical protein
MMCIHSSSNGQRYYSPTRGTLLLKVPTFDTALNNDQCKEENNETISRSSTVFIGNLEWY